MKRKPSRQPRTDNRVAVQQMAPVTKTTGLILTIPNLTDMEYDVLREVCQKTLRGLRGRP